MSEENGTYIKLFRKITDWEWYTDVSTCKLFIHILLKASATGRKFRGQIIPAGSFTTSVALLSSETGLSSKQVRTALEKLKSTGEITTQGANKYTQIFVIKWDDYQSFISYEGKQRASEMANKGQTKGKQRATIKDSKDSKNIYIKEKYKKEKSQFELAMDDFREMRKAIKKPMTEKAEQMILKKLQTLAPDNEEVQIAIINQSIENCWTSVYPLPSPPRTAILEREEKLIDHDDSNNPIFSQEDMDKLLERRKRLAN